MVVRVKHNDEPDNSYNIVDNSWIVAHFVKTEITSHKKKKEKKKKPWYEIQNYFPLRTTLSYPLSSSCIIILKITSLWEQR